MSLLLLLGIALLSSCEMPAPPPPDSGVWVDGSKLPGQADIRIRDETPLYDVGARTELNVTGWFADSLEMADDREAVAMRLYNDTDFRAEMLAGKTTEGVIMDARTREHGRPSSYALQAMIVGETAVQLNSSYGGEYEVDFSTVGRVSGAFTARLTDGEGNVEPRDISVRFELPVYVDCYRNLDANGDERRLDPDFTSEFCAAFKAWKWDGE